MINNVCFGVPNILAFDQARKEQHTNMSHML